MGCTQQKLPIEYSTIVEQAKDGETEIRRNCFNQQLIDSYQGMQTLQDIYQNSIKLYGNNNYLGTIQPDRTIRFRTYNEVYELAQQLGSGLINLNLVYSTNEDYRFNLKLIGIFSKNREEWQILDFANVLYGNTMVPIYDTLGPDTISYVLKHSQIKTLFISKLALLNLLKSDDWGNLQTLVLIDDCEQDLLQQARNKIKFLQKWDDILKSGKNKIQKFQQVQPNEIFTLSYTSGTTGYPKGAMISQQNMAAAIGSLQFTSIQITAQDVHMSYLPLPHIYERIIVNLHTSQGASIVFFGGDINKLKDDLQTISPTIFFGVPRLYNKFFTAINTQMKSQTGCKKSLIESGFSSKTESAKNGEYQHKLYDSIIFKKTKAIFGSRVRMLLNASAPLSDEVRQYMNIISCCSMIIAYGLTETTGAAFVTDKDDPLLGHIGAPVQTVEYKLVDVPEMQYTSKDVNSDQQAQPRGEICIRGTTIFVGYYKDQEKTQEAIDKDGWLHTGDIGTILPTGALKIIDRKKNIFKLQQGEYIAPDKIEQIYVRANGVQEAYIHGDSFQSYCVAIIVPNKDVFMQMAKDNLIEGTYEELCKNQKMNEIILNSLTSQGKADGLYGFEQAKVIYLEPISLLEHGCLSSTMKLQRHIARKKFDQQIQQMYSPEIKQKIENYK